MPRTADSAVRARLLESAARLLWDGAPTTLRSVAAGAGTTTMAVYTHFGGMPQLLDAVRREGFTRLAARLAAVPGTADAVHDLMALAGVYVTFALAEPALYRRMFDARADLTDPAAADATFGTFVRTAARACEDGRLGTTDPLAAATQLWAAGHGVVSLVLSGVLPAEAVDAHLPALSAAALVGFGDHPDDARRSVAGGWAAGRATDEVRP